MKQSGMPPSGIHSHPYATAAASRPARSLRRVGNFLKLDGLFVTFQAPRQNNAAKKARAPTSRLPTNGKTINWWRDTSAPRLDQPASRLPRAIPSASFSSRASPPSSRSPNLTSPSAPLSSRLHPAGLPRSAPLARLELCLDLQNSSYHLYI
jgi:hypothetical protein